MWSVPHLANWYYKYLATNLINTMRLNSIYVSTTSSILTVSREIREQYKHLVKSSVVPKRPSWLRVRVKYLATYPSTAMKLNSRNMAWGMSPLDPSHARHQSLGFQAVHQRWYKSLLLHPVCRVCAAVKFVLNFVASCEKHGTHTIGLILSLMPDACFWPIRARAQGSYSGLIQKYQKWLISTRMIF